MAAGSRSIRTQRQQEQNKQAQQRYRERKKQKAEQLESQFSSMQQQMQELQRVLRHNVTLQVTDTSTNLPYVPLANPSNSARRLRTSTKGFCRLCKHRLKDFSLS